MPVVLGVSVAPWEGRWGAGMAVPGAGAAMGSPGLSMHRACSGCDVPGCTAVQTGGGISDEL